MSKNMRLLLPILGTSISFFMFMYGKELLNLIAMFPLGTAILFSIMNDDGSEPRRDP